MPQQIRKTLRLSPYGQRALIPAPIARMMSTFADEFRPGVDLNLGVGYVNEQTIPGEAIADAVRWVVRHPEAHPHAMNYGGPTGSANLIAALKRFLLRNQIGNLEEAQLEKRAFVIGASGVTSLLEAVASILAPGEVLTSDPMYYIYANTLERQGHRVVAIPEDERGIRVELLLEQGLACLETLSFVYVVTVGNPTSTVLDTARRRELVHAVTELSHKAGRPIPLLLDNAYELLVHDPEVDRMDSGFKYDDLGIVYELGTLSKALAPALRIGYLHGPPGELMNAVVQRTNDIGLSAPLITQEVAAHLLDTMADDHLRIVQAGYREKSLVTRDALTRHLGDEIELLYGGQAGFYYYLTLRNLRSDEGSPLYRSAMRSTGNREFDGPVGARKPRVLYVPGVFFVHPRGQLQDVGKRQLRISYGYASRDELERAIALLGEAARFSLRHAG